MLKLIVSIFAILGIASAFAQSGNAEQEFKRKLEAASSKNKTIQCDFTQIKKVKNIKQPISSKGRFFYDNSGLTALHYIEPVGDKVIMNGDSFTVVVSGKTIAGDASSNPMMAQISYMMQACMSGDVSKLGRGWSMTMEDTTENYKVKLTPTDRRVQKYISAMSMCFDKSDLTLSVLRIEEISGGYTEYNFTDKVISVH